MSPIVGIKRQLEQTPGFGQKKKERETRTRWKKADVFGVKRKSVYKGERELTSNTTLRLKSKTKTKDVTIENSKNIDD